MWVLYPGRIEFWRVAFSTPRKTRELIEKPSGRSKNQQQTQTSPGQSQTKATAHIGGRRALSPLCKPASSGELSTKN